MTIDEVITQLEDHLLKAIDESDPMSTDISCDDCQDRDAGERCFNDTLEAVNVALTVLRQKRG